MSVECARSVEGHKCSFVRIALTIAALGAGEFSGGCSGESKPSTTKIIEPHRPAIERFVASLDAIQEHMATAPTAEAPVDSGGVMLEASCSEGNCEQRNTVIVAATELGSLSRLGKKNRPSDTKVQASSERNLWLLLRWLDGLLGSNDELSIRSVQDLVTWYPRIRYAAVVTTERTVDGAGHITTFRGGWWYGHAVVWDLAQGRWLPGRVTAEVEDNRKLVSVNTASPSQSINRSVNGKINEAIAEALRTRSHAVARTQQ
ncbi:MAG TPA: hypothetical protein VML75_06560 [Kofleriaceae bacterium]|nr:hypothetical protein [Kofleriaceae bacterium]